MKGLNLKKLMLGLLAAMSVGATCAEEEISPSGGLIKRIPDRTKWILIRDRQTIFSEKEVREIVDTFDRELYRPVVYVKGDAAVTNVRIGVEVTLLDKPAYNGATLLAAPEQGWSQMSCDWLVTDKPDPEKRRKRLNRELIRALSSAIGMGVSEFQPDIMAVVKSVGDLDRLRMDGLNPPGEIAMDYASPRWGVQKIRFTTYDIACREGWAPEPSNKVQKAIWDKVHAPPEKPMKITYDKDKQKPVVK